VTAPRDTLKLTDRKVLDQAHACLKAHLPLQAEGYTCTTDDLLSVLLAVATQRGTVESVCADLAGTPDPEAIRTYFKEQLRLEDFPALARGVNAALAAEIPFRVWRQAREVAIDFQDRPYYGKTPQAEGAWVRGRARDGTTRFYRVATAYVMLNHLRVTLAIHFVLPDDDTVTVLDDLRNRQRALRECPGYAAAALPSNARMGGLDCDRRIPDHDRAGRAAPVFRLRHASAGTGLARSAAGGVFLKHPTRGAAAGV
jgi:hypothetical protein